MAAMTPQLPYREGRVLRFAEGLLRSANLTPGALSHNRVFKKVVDGVDILPRLFFRKHFATLPPAHLRIRAGVGRAVLNHHVEHLHGVRQYWLYALSKGYFDMCSTILDIGCGCGRYAQYLRDYGLFDGKFQGSYIGIDIDEEAINWCNRSFDSRFKFCLSTEKYRLPSDNYTPYSLPVDNSSIDLVFSMSLYTHLLEEEMINCTRETHRVLKMGGYVNATFFSLDHPPPSYGGRHTFRHQIGNAYVELESHPEAAIAYREQFISRIFEEAGFKNITFAWEKEKGGQVLLIAQKG